MVNSEPFGHKNSPFWRWAEGHTIMMFFANAIDYQMSNQHGYEDCYCVTTNRNFLNWSMDSFDIFVPVNEEFKK